MRTACSVWTMVTAWNFAYFRDMQHPLIAPPVPPAAAGPVVPEDQLLIELAGGNLEYASTRFRGTARRLTPNVVKFQ
jgi:hypothetical protein